MSDIRLKATDGESRIYVRELPPEAEYEFRVTVARKVPVQWKVQLDRKVVTEAEVRRILDNWLNEAKLK